MTDDGDDAVAVATCDQAVGSTPATSGRPPTPPADRWALIAFLVVAVVSIPVGPAWHRMHALNL